jgi:superfamily II DNA helicase RecQ
LEGEKNLQNPSKSRVDYRDVLNENDFAVFAKLRSLRKRIAEQEGVPVYAVFTNEQLAAMVQKKVLTQNAFGTIDGVGKMRLEKYAESFLKILRNEPATTPYQSTVPNRRMN